MCMTPSIAFKEIVNRGPRSIILTSGTMTPLPVWEQELNMEFKVTLVHDHVIKPEQLHAAVVSRGALGRDMDFRFSNIKKRP